MAVGMMITVEEADMVVATQEEVSSRGLMRIAGECVLFLFGFQCECG